MAKDKKKSDWDNLQEMLSQNADDWAADETSTAPVAEERSNDDAETEGEAAAPKKSVKTKRSCGEKKVKAAKTRKKAAPKTDKIDAALASSPVEESQDAETLDLTVAESEKTPKKRRRTTKKAEDETELVKNVLKLEKETKAKKRSRVKAAEANPFVGLLSQIERVAQDEPEAEAAEEPIETETVEAPIETVAEETADSGDFFADFFADDAVEELDISWGRPRVDAVETAVEETDEPEATVEEAETEAPVEIVAEEAAPRRRERRRRRRDDREAPEAPVETSAPTTDDAKTDLDLNDLEAFFATDSFGDEGVGFAPRRETKKAEKPEAPERAEKPRRDEETLERPIPSEAAFDVDDEDDEPRSKRKRRRRRGSRRPFEDDVETPTTLDEAEAETVDEAEEIPADAFETARAPRDRRRRERRPRREARADFADETEEPAVDEASDERRAVAPERVLPSWSDAISHVVRFNMSRRVNRRR